MSDIVYSIVDTKAENHRHILSVMVDNEAGVLARVIGLFSARGYNIDSLTVAEVDEARKLSRITIVTWGDDAIINQIKAQLARLVPVYSVHDMTVECKFVERELALVKVRGTDDNRVEAMRLAEIFRAKVVDVTTESFVFEITGTWEKINRFTELMRPLGLINIVRTGSVAISRGPVNLSPAHERLKKAKAEQEAAKKQTKTKAKPKTKPAKKPARKKAKR